MSRKIDCMETECCDCIEIHGDCIKKVMERMPAEETLNDLAALFKVFGDPTRVKILYVLFQDLYSFPRTFSNYGKYKESTPFLIPSRKSLMHCRNTRRGAGRK